jgi:hypothetical protein
VITVAKLGMEFNLKLLTITAGGPHNIKRDGPVKLHVCYTKLRNQISGDSGGCSTTRVLHAPTSGFDERTESIK